MNLFQRIFTRKSYPPVIVNPNQYRGIDIQGLQNIGIVSTKTCDTRTIEGQRNAYMYCPAVAEIINYKVAASCNAKFKIVNSEGSEVKSRFDAVLQKPNGSQNWIQFWQYAKTLQQIFGKAFIYARKLPGITSISEIYVMPNWEVNEVTGETSWVGGGIGWTSKVKSYEWTHCGRMITVSTDDVFIMNDIGVDVGNVNGQYSQGQSRLLPLGDAVQNIIAAYEARNMLLTNAGPPVIISPDGRDAVGSMPLMTEDKQEMESKFLKEYGISRNKKQIAFASNPVKATFIGKNPNDLAAFEEVRDDLLEVCRGYGVPAYIFGIEGTTFNNLSEAKKSLYQETVIPETKSDLSQFVQYFGITESFIGDFDHVEVLQDSENKRADALQKNVDLYGKLYQDGIITLNTYLEEISQPTVANGDKFVSEITTQPLAVRIGVGGTQSLQAILADPNLTDDQKRGVLIVLFGISEAEANQMLNPK